MTKKLDNLYEMDRFLKKYKLLKLTQEDFFFNLNISITGKEIKLIIKTISKEQYKEQSVAKMTLLVNSTTHLNKA